MEPTDHNLRAWEARHAQMEGQGLPRWVLDGLPDVAGRHVLELACGAGLASAELAALGALLTGLDDSAEELEAARARVPNAVFIQANVRELPAELQRRRFDAVLGSAATPARQVAAALRPGGEFVLYDTHPVLGCLDAALRWRESYFREGALPLGAIVTSVARAGFVVVSLDEAPAVERRRQDPRVPAEFMLRARKPA